MTNLVCHAVAEDLIESKETSAFHGLSSNILNRAGKLKNAHKDTHVATCGGESLCFLHNKMAPRMLKTCKKIAIKLT